MTLNCRGSKTRSKQGREGGFVSTSFTGLLRLLLNFDLLRCTHLNYELWRWFVLNIEVDIAKTLNYKVFKRCFHENLCSLKSLWFRGEINIKWCIEILNKNWESWSYPGKEIVNMYLVTKFQGVVRCLSLHVSKSLLQHQVQAGNMWRWNHLGSF